MAPLGGTWGAQRGHFGGLGASGGSPRGSLGLPGRSLGSSGGVPGGPRWGPWGGLGRFWGPLERTAAKKVARINGNHGLGTKNGPKREPQGTHFGSQNRYKIASKFGSDSGDVFWCSQVPPEAKKLDFHWSVVQNRRSTFLRPGAPEVDFGSHFGTQKGPKIKKKWDRNSKKNRKRKKSPTWAPKVATAIIGSDHRGAPGPVWGVGGYY